MEIEIVIKKEEGAWEARCNGVLQCYSVDIEKVLKELIRVKDNFIE